MFIIDVQGFQYRKDLNFTCKEISIFNVKDESCMHKILRLPISYGQLNNKIKQQIGWITNNLHGLQWSSNNDNLLYRDLPMFIRRQVPYQEESILVKGLEKKLWLQQYLPNNNIIDLSNYCNKISDLISSNIEFHCKEHNINSLRCTNQIVYSIYQWYTVNRNKLDVCINIF